MKDVSLLINDTHGNYIPQIFGQVYNSPGNFTNYDEVKELLEFLAKKGSHKKEEYWKVWDELISKAIIVFPNDTTGYIYQDGDVWGIPHDLPKYKAREFFGDDDIDQSPVRVRVKADTNYRIDMAEKLVSDMDEMGISMDFVEHLPGNVIFDVRPRSWEYDGDRDDFEDFINESEYFEKL